ncbi:hypothetical protein S140_80 [Shewanella sp. phage 1/40]|uniref:hypothetical protein n=1 Tax=Shewanella phage 1/4 TaxID=1458859 RepID=UPI0004F8C757|nr:hypothetical protein S14_80 [Shewanella sp. phage 1/4]YP_009104081.1 hypothetical protein S140_80 [Shewanella sp. phage 1/40]AHK11192.1 hypothetical protein S14_80 [Shewanella sp. phage 1/4]AHK11490.1 hypothetical protein S140_80 [Shewanella sp. phage 1/40]
MKHQQYIACKRDGTFEFRNGEPVLKQEGDIAIFNCEDSLDLSQISMLSDYFYNNPFKTGTFSNPAVSLEESRIRTKDKINKIKV